MTAHFRAVVKIAQILGKADPDFLQNAARAGNAQHSGAQTPIGGDECALNVHWRPGLISLCVLERLRNHDCFARSSHIVEIICWTFAGADAVLAPFISRQPFIWVEAGRPPARRCAMAMARLRSPTGSHAHIAARVRGRQNQDWRQDRIDDAPAPQPGFCKNPPTTRAKERKNQSRPARWSPVRPSALRRAAKREARLLNHQAAAFCPRNCPKYSRYRRTRRGRRQTGPRSNKWP